MNGLVAVTGAGGFVGRAIVADLASRGFRVRAVVRREQAVAGGSEVIASGDLRAAEPGRLFAGCEAVVHCAARVHVTGREDPAAAAAAYHVMNSELPVALAERAKAAGVRRWVQLSSAAAVASRSERGETISDHTPPQPTTPYGRSKLAADLALAALASDMFHVVSVRPPAVFGPGVGAFFAMFDRAARAGLPLPLDGVGNRRSFVYVGNLADAVARALGAARSGAWLVTDSAPLSTGELYRRLLAHHGFSGRRAWPLPGWLLRPAARIALGERADSLLGDAAFDGSRFASDFGWIAPTPLDEALALTVSARQP